MAKIVFFEIENWEKGYLRKAFKKHKLVFFNEKLTSRNVSKAKDADVLAVFIYSKVDKKVLDSMPKLKLVTTMSTGFDHIDLIECKKRKIKVCNVPTYGSNTVAEHTFALILNISRKMTEALNKTKMGDFRLTGLRGFDLKDKTIGVVGCGNIGKHVARIATGFEMNVLLYDVKKDLKLAKQLKCKYVSLSTLLKKSDIISLHAP
jgi:D-lactate dehydrogenase